MDAADAEKRLRTVRKKLQQIEKLKEKSGQLDEDARKKLESEPELQREAAALELQVGGGGGSTTDVPPPKAPEPPPPTKQAAKSKPKEVSAPPAKAQEAVPVSAPRAPQAAPEAERTGPSLEQEKQIQKLKKKLGQIAKLKEKGGTLDPEAQQKLDSEVRIRRDIELLQQGQDPPVEEEKPRPAGVEEVETEEPQREEPQREDPHAAARAEQLEPAPSDLGLLIDDETEKRFKSLQKKLRDIGKLHDQTKIDKLQEAKLQAEPGIIEELVGLRALAAEKIANRRAAAAEAAKRAPAPKARQMAQKSGQVGGPSWECASCGKTGDPSQLESDNCPFCGHESLLHYVPKCEDDDGEDDGEDKAAKARKNKESQDLKTAGRRKAQAGGAAKQSEGGGQPTPGSAAWPELKEVLESGECGVDKSRQKKGILVDRPKSESPYDAFDSVLLRCNFLTRIELRLAPTVLEQESFMLYFPGMLSDSLLELILKGNKLTTVPPGIGELSRIRSIDLSHNAISTLPSPETWANIAGSLELLDVSFNKLDSIAALEPLSKLSSLKLDANQLTSLQGLSWKAVKQLSSLTAVGNSIEELPEAVGECAESLTHLDVSENRITVVPTAIKDLRKLKSLSLAGNPIKDQKAVNNAEKGIKDLKAYLTKMAPKRKAK